MSAGIENDTLGFLTAPVPPVPVPQEQPPESANEPRLNEFDLTPEEQAEQDERALLDWQHTCRVVITVAKRDAECMRRKLLAARMASVMGRRTGMTQAQRAALQAELDEHMKTLAIWEARLEAAYDEYDSKAAEEIEITARRARYQALADADVQDQADK